MDEDNDLDRAYVYDGLGRRVEVKDDGVVTNQFLYLDQLRPSAWLDGSGDIKATFIYLTGRIAPDVMIKADGSRYRLIQDERGSIRSVVNSATGDVEQRITYDPWGRELTNTASSFQPFGYAGGLTDRSTSLVHFGAREYNPATGQFLTRDPIEDVTGDPYGYADGNPIMNTDPTGLFGIPGIDTGYRDRRRGEPLLVLLWGRNGGRNRRNRRSRRCRSGASNWHIVEHPPLSKWWRRGEHRQGNGQGS